MALELKRISYNELKPRQQEGYNFQKVSSILADYGFTTIRLTDDWEGADFIAQHSDGATFLKIQLKGRLYFAKKYIGKDLYICFRDSEQWYLYPHDELLQKLINDLGLIGHTQSWQDGVYHFPSLSQDLYSALKFYKL